MRGYSYFADYYDALTKNVEYRQRADYLCSLLERLEHAPGLLLDLACGTGSLTLELKKRGIDCYGIDGSPEMLSVAQQKAARAGEEILFLCQKMQEIDLYGTVDTVVCCLDSINHLTCARDVQRTFERVSLFLNPGGYFIFDVNSVYKHTNILADNTFVYDTGDVFCVWQNTLTENTGKVHIHLDFFERDGNCYYRRQEDFSERAYTHGELLAMLEQAGLKFVCRYEDGSFREPQADTQRILYIARK